MAVLKDLWLCLLGGRSELFECSHSMFLSLLPFLNLLPEREGVEEYQEDGSEIAYIVREALMAASAPGI